MEWVKIIINDVPLYPDGWYDEKYLPGRIYEDDLEFPIDIKTDKAFKHIDDEYTEKVRPVLNKMLKKYTIIAFAKETISLSIIRASSNLQIYFEEDGNPETWNIEVLDISKAEVNETYNYEYRISFLKLEPDEITVNNYLISSYLLDKYAATSLIKLNFNSNRNYYSQYTTVANQLISFDVNSVTSSLVLGDPVIIKDVSNTNINFPIAGQVTNIDPNTIIVTMSGLSSSVSESGEFSIGWIKTDALDYDFYTALIPTFGILPMDAKSTENDGAEYTSAQTIYETVNCRFYMIESDKILLGRVKDIIDDITITYDGSTYRSRPGYGFITDINEDGVLGVYKVDVTLKYKKTDFIKNETF